MLQDLSVLKAKRAKLLQQWHTRERIIKERDQLVTLAASFPEDSYTAKHYVAQVAQRERLLVKVVDPRLALRRLDIELERLGA